MNAMWEKHMALWAQGARAPDLAWVGGDGGSRKASLQMWDLSQDQL